LNPSAPTVAVFGGAFDPPHQGHVLLPAVVLAYADVAKVLVVPSFAHPFDKPMSDYDHRVAMCQHAFAPYGSLVEVSRIEEGLGQSDGPVYTIDTLEALQKTGISPRLVIGTDILSEVDRWHRFSDIQERFSPIIVGRTGFPSPPELGCLPALPDVRSRNIRTALKNRSSDLSGLPGVIHEYIRTNGLYPPGEGS